MHFLGQNVPYMNSVVYNLADDGLIELKYGYKGHHKLQMIITGREICWIKYYLFSLLHAMWITLNLIMLPHAPVGACRVLKTP
jgi:hypothetical protein